MGINSSDFIQFTARYLEQFLKGLSLCGVIGNYTIQFLEAIEFSSKEETVIQSYLIQLLTNLQFLLKSFNTVPVKNELNELEKPCNSLVLKKDVPVKEAELPISSAKYNDSKDEKIYIQKGPSCAKTNKPSENSVFETYFGCPNSMANESKVLGNASNIKDKCYEEVINEEPPNPSNSSEIYDTLRDCKSQEVTESLPQNSVNNYLQKIFTIHVRETDGSPHTFKGIAAKSEISSVPDDAQSEIEEGAQRLPSVDLKVSSPDTPLRVECKASRVEFPNLESPDTDVAEILDFNGEDNEVIISVGDLAGNTPHAPVIQTKRITRSDGSKLSAKSGPESSQTIFADIVKLGPNDLNGHPWCEFCEKEFPSAGSLKRHLASSHTKVLWCHTCLKAVNSKGEMRKHISDHHSDLANVCLVCGKSFKSPPSLQRHMGVHKGSRGTACEICGQTYSRSEYHKEHMRVHTGEKPFKCTVCKRSFSKSSNLATHMVIHKPTEEGHLCSLCFKVFRRQDKLKEHTMRHLKIKRFICKLCPKAYSEKRDLTKHLNKFHIPDRGEAKKT